MLTIAQAKRELAGYPPHNVAVALRKLACLVAFWKADKAAGGRDRCATRWRVAKQLTVANPSQPVSYHMLEKWETLFLRHGITRLAIVRGRPENGVRMTVGKELSGLSTADLLMHAKRALTVLSSRLASQK